MPRYRSPSRSPSPSAFQRTFTPESQRSRANTPTPGQSRNSSPGYNDPYTPSTSSRSSSPPRGGGHQHGPNHHSKGKPVDLEPNEEDKISSVKTSLLFLGAVGAATYAAHRFWPKGVTYGEAEDWELEKEVKEDKKEKKEERNGRGRGGQQQGGGGGGGRNRDREDNDMAPGEAVGFTQRRGVADADKTRDRDPDQDGGRNRRGGAYPGGPDNRRYAGGSIDDGPPRRRYLEDRGDRDRRLLPAAAGAAAGGAGAAYVLDDRDRRRRPDSRDRYYDDDRGSQVTSSEADAIVVPVGRRTRRDPNYYPPSTQRYSTDPIPRGGGVRGGYYDDSREASSSRSRGASRSGEPRSTTYVIRDGGLTKVASNTSARSARDAGWDEDPSSRTRGRDDGSRYYKEEVVTDDPRVRSVPRSRRQQVDERERDRYDDGYD